MHAAPNSNTTRPINIPIGPPAVKSEAKAVQIPDTAPVIVAIRVFIFVTTAAPIIVVLAIKDNSLKVLNSLLHYLYC